MSPQQRALAPGPRPGRLQGVVTTRRLVSSVALAVATGLLLIGLWDSKDGGTAVRLRPAPVLSVSPLEGATALRQEPISARLAPDYTGELAVDGVAIPLDQTERPADAISGSSDAAPKALAGLNQITFTPGEGKELTSLRASPHTATVLFWPRIGGSRDRAETYSWSFTSR